MRQACVTPKATKAFQLHLLTVLFFCVIVPACDNGCFIFVSNPSGGTIAVGTSTCKLSNLNGTVSMQFTSSLQPISGQSSSIQHVFVSLRGIEAHPSATADEDSPDWQELLPTLKTQPWQVDLMERNDDSHSVNLVRETVITAGTYSQIRMLLVPNQPATGEPIPERNDCRSTGFNCIIAADGAIRPLVVNGGGRQVRITSEQISGEFFQVLPGSITKLDLEFNPDSILSSPARPAVQVTPMFFVRSEFSVDSREDP